MQKIAGDGATIDGHFQDADASLGQVATEITDEWLNAVQDELVNTIEGAGITINPGDSTQLLQAIRGLSGHSRNVLINGDFALWQRVQSLLIADATARYVADRWLVSAGTGNTDTLVVARQSFTLGQVLVPGDPRFHMVWNQGGGLNGSTHPRLAQRIEHAYTFNSRTVVFSFWAKLNSGSSWNVTPKLRQHFGGGGSSADVTTTGTPVVVTSSWQRFTSVFNVPSTAGKTFTNPNHYLELYLEMDKAASVVAFFADWQLELGGSPSSFDRRPIQQELQLAQRYYTKSYELDTDPGDADYLGSQMGEESGVNFQSANCRFVVPMRASPTVRWYSPDSGTIDRVYWAGADRTVSSTQSTSTVSTGYPVISASQSNTKAFAHFTADAEL